MYGRKKAARVLWFAGLFLVVTGFAIFTWAFKSLGGGSSLGIPSSFEINPGERKYSREYVYFHDITEIIITLNLHPSITYTFNMTKIGGNWTCKESGAGHSALSVKPPSRGVYELILQFQTNGNDSEKLRGSVMWTVNSWDNNETYLHSSSYIIIIGLAFLLSSFLLKGAKDAS